jgi:hypothetical protein
VRGCTTEQSALNLMLEQSSHVTQLLMERKLSGAE